MKTAKQVLEATIVHQVIGEQHSVLINDLVSGKHIRYPVTTKSDAEYVSSFLRTVMANTLHQVIAAEMISAVSTSADAAEVPPSVTGPADLNNPELEADSSAENEDESDLSLEQMG